jgi:hypothetical protein
MAEAAGDAAGLAAEKSHDEELPGSRQSRELHTLEERMKGEKEIDGDRTIGNLVDEVNSVEVVEVRLLDRNENQFTGIKWNQKPYGYYTEV